MFQKGSVSLILVFSIIVVSGLIASYLYFYKTSSIPQNASKVSENQAEQPLSNKKSQDMVVAKNSLEELKTILGPNTKEACLKTVLPLVHPYPGYKYEKLTGTTRSGGIYDEKANVLISLTAEGLVNTEALKDFSEDIRKDSYSFEMHYDEANDSCKISDRSNIFSWLFPQEISDQAKELAKQNQGVKDFYKKYKNISLSYVDWLETGRSEYTNNRDMLVLVSDKNSVYVYLGLSGDIENTQFGVSVPVLVDIKNGNVILGEETIADRTPK